MTITPERHNAIIDQAMQEIQDGVFDTLKALENRVAELVGTGQPPEQLRSQIVQAYQQYAAAVGGETAPVTTIAETVDVESEFEPSPDDLSARQVLGQNTAQTVSGVVTGGVEDMMSTLVLAGAAGVGTQQLVNMARGRVSGVYMETDDPVTRRIQRELLRLTRRNDATPAEIREAVMRIRERLTGINTTSSLRDLTARSVQEAVMKFDGAYTAGQAKRRGITRWRYDGGVIDETRDWCQEHVGNTYTEAEIYELWENNDWGGKEPGDPFIVRGGYNCRHFWTPIEE